MTHLAGLRRTTHPVQVSATANGCRTAWCYKIAAQRAPSSSSGRLDNYTLGLCARASPMACLMWMLPHGSGRRATAEQRSTCNCTTHRGQHDSPNLRSPPPLPTHPGVQGSVFVRFFAAARVQSTRPNAHVQRGARSVRAAKPRNKRVLVGEMRVWSGSPNARKLEMRVRSRRPNARVLETRVQSERANARKGTMHTNRVRSDH